MRVAWVHPSWRDLVIDYLAHHDAVRARYLRSSSIHGTLLALSAEGGADGERRLPLLRRDRDWDAVSDRVFELAPDLEPAELIGLLGSVRRTIIDVKDTAAGVEADALARTVLTRVSALWAAAAHAPIPIPELAAWFELAGILSPGPTAPPRAGPRGGRGSRAPGLIWCRSGPRTSLTAGAWSASLIGSRSPNCCSAMTDSSCQISTSGTIRRARSSASSTPSPATTPVVNSPRLTRRDEPLITSASCSLPSSNTP
jgi:hypothetical protein